MKINSGDLISVKKSEDFNLLNSLNNRFLDGDKILGVEEYFTGRDKDTRAYNTKPENNDVMKCTTKKEDFALKKAVFKNGRAIYMIPPSYSPGTTELKQRKFVEYEYFYNNSTDLQECEVSTINSLYIQDVIKLGDNSRSLVLEQMLKKYFDL